MNSSATCLDEDEARLLRRMLGRRIPWIYGTPFLVEGELTVAMRLAMFVGPTTLEAAETCLSFGSERFETKEFLDYARFRIGISDSLGGALGTAGRLYVDTSALVDLGQGELKCIRILSARIDEDREESYYDAVIRFEFDDGRILSIGHAPGVYEGVCVTQRASVTLGNQRTLLERLVIAP